MPPRSRWIAVAGIGCAAGFATLIWQPADIQSSLPRPSVQPEDLSKTPPKNIEKEYQGSTALIPTAPANPAPSLGTSPPIVIPPSADLAETLRIIQQENDKRQKGSAALNPFGDVN